MIRFFPALGLPAYQKHLRAAYRQQAQMQLQQAAIRLELYYQQHHSYEGITFSSLDIGSNQTYLFQLETPDTQHFMLQAIPQQAQLKDTCGTLTLDQSGSATLCS